MKNLTRMILFGILSAVIWSRSAKAQTTNTATTGPTEVVTFRVFDGKTALPMRSGFLRLNCRTATNALCSTMRRVESSVERKHGLAKYEVSADATKLYQFSTSLAECDYNPAMDPKGDPYKGKTELSAGEVERIGVTFKRSCAGFPPATGQEIVAKPGEVILYYRHYSLGEYLKPFVVPGPCWPL